MLHIFTVFSINIISDYTLITCFQWPIFNFFLKNPTFITVILIDIFWKTLKISIFSITNKYIFFLFWKDSSTIGSYPHKYDTDRYYTIINFDTFDVRTRFTCCCLQFLPIAKCIFNGL